MTPAIAHAYPENHTTHKTAVDIKCGVRSGLPKIAVLSLRRRSEKWLGASPHIECTEWSGNVKQTSFGKIYRFAGAIVLTLLPREK